MLFRLVESTSALIIYLNSPCEFFFPPRWWWRSNEYLECVGAFCLCALCSGCWPDLTGPTSSETDRERAEYKRIIAPERQQQSSKKRKESEGQMVIEREQGRLKKSKQRVVMYTPGGKKKRMSEETNVFIQAGLNKRQKANGQDSCAQLACSTHNARKGKSQIGCIYYCLFCWLLNRTY